MLSDCHCSCWSSRSVNWKSLGWQVHSLNALAPLAQSTREKAVDADEGSGDFVEEADKGTIAHANDVAGHEDRLDVAGSGGVGAGAEDAPVHFALMCEADKFDLNLSRRVPESRLIAWFRDELWGKIKRRG